MPSDAEAIEAMIDHHPPSLTDLLPMRMGRSPLRPRRLPASGDRRQLVEPGQLGAAGPRPPVGLRSQANPSARSSVNSRSSSPAP